MWIWNRGVVVAGLALCLQIGCGPVGQADVASSACDDGGPTCVGSTAPAFSLTDFQPDSPHFEEAYGLARFEGTVTVVALWASW